MKKILSKLFASLAIVVTLISFTAFAAVDKDSPSDVIGLKGIALKEGAKISWDSATDNLKVAGYQVHYDIKSVQNPGEKYAFVKDVGNVLTYNVTPLENGKKYYFSVIAYDEAGNESANWGAPEVSVTPAADAPEAKDNTAPQVSKALALSKEQVKIVFSEEIILPKVDPQDAFQIEDEDTLEPLAILKAEMDTEDLGKKTVILSTAPQTDKSKYKLTVGIDIEDTFGNPVISGTSDTAEFDGSGADKVAADAKGPEVVKVEPMDNTHVIVTFNETVVLGIDPSQNFNIVEAADATKQLQILGVELGKNSENVEDSSAIVTTSPQGEIKYTVSVLGLKDESGNEVSAAKATGEFTGVAKAKTPDNIDDILPPKDIAKLMADYVFSAGKYVVNLSWENPVENKNDTKEQLVYLSQDQGTSYAKKASLDAAATKYSVNNLTPGEYWFKITQKDTSGNESEGIVKKVTLAETGPELLGLVALSLVAGKFVTKKRK
ncbi:MAG: fibronectin type III domain-containing protein [Candidatus Peregrinibacteria bacterium]|nr:fibronectin type III domain-containing protein [Candidatus Peregrinibacteria bacterium]